MPVSRIRLESSAFCRYPEWVWTSPHPRNYNQDFAEAITYIISIRGTTGQSKQVHRASLLSPSMKLVNGFLLVFLHMLRYSSH